MSERGAIVLRMQTMLLLAPPAAPAALATSLASHEFHETCHSVIFYFMKKKTPNDAVTPRCQSQFTPKMKANAVRRLLSSCELTSTMNVME